MISSFHVCVRLWSYLEESLRAESHACLLQSVYRQVEGSCGGLPTAFAMVLSWVIGRGLTCALVSSLRIGRWETSLETCRGCESKCMCI